MNIVLSARGSRGDVYPVLALASALQARGHQVRVCVPGFFSGRARSLGLSCREYQEDTLALMRGFGAGWQAARTALRWFAESIEEEFEILLEETRDAQVLVTTAAEVPPASVAELRRIPYYRIAYAPILPGDQPPPLQPFQTLPAALNRALWVSLNASIKMLFGTRLDRWRVRLGLPLAGELGSHLARSGHTFLAVSPRLAPPSPLWAQRGYRHHYLGYCFDDGEAARLPRELECFLDRWPPPVYVGFGSVHLGDPRRLLAALVDAALRSGCRLVLGSGWAGLGQGEALPPQVMAVGEVPHRLLFPRVAAAIHHGGSGTVHNAARFGLPQLAVPQMADQFYWAHRIFKLGLGPRPLRPGELSASRLATALRRLTRQDLYRDRARAVARSLREEPGLAAGVAIIESAAPHSSSSVMTGPLLSSPAPVAERVTV